MRPERQLRRLISRYVRFRMLCLAGVLWFFAMCSVGWGNTKGDAELFRVVKALREQNNRQVLTWQGKIQFNERVRGITQHGAVDKSMIAKEIDFTLDMAKESFLWHETTTQAMGTKSFLGLATTAKEMKEDGMTELTDALVTTSGMHIPVGLYELKPLIKRRGSDTRENCLVIYSPSNAKKRLNQMSVLMPTDYLSTWQGLDIDAMLMLAYRQADKTEETQRSIEQQGQKVIYRVGQNGYTWSYTFDLAKGGSLVTVENSGTDMQNTYEYEFVQIDGVWLPKAFKCKRVSRANPAEKVIHEEEVQFVENVINKDIPESAFTVEAMGVHSGYYITDNRIGASYYYGGTEVQNLPDLVWQMDDATMLPVADEATVLAAANPNEPHSVRDTTGTSVPTRNIVEMPSVPAAASRARPYWLYIASGVLVVVVAVLFVMYRQSKRKEKK